MDDALDGLGAEDRRYLAGVADIRDDTGRTIEASVLWDRVEVEDDHAMALGEQLAGGVGADVSGSAGDEDLHRT